MKKVLLTTILAAAVASASAQLPDGSVAPNFTATDINGNSHTLYDYLDNGYTVVIDVSAAWCGPCWSYHTSGALEDLFINHGPSGMANVSGSTTDDVMVLFVEGQSTNTLAQLQGTQGSTGNAYADNTQGDWVSGTPYPIIDNASVAQTLGIAYFPTVYTIYPDRYLEESGQMTTTGHYNNITGNIGSHTGSTGGVDGSIFNYTGETSTCSDLSVSVNVQNKGDQTLAAGATVTVMDGSTVLGTGTTTTALDQYDIEEVTVSVSISANTTLTIEVTAAGDLVAGNNTYSQAVTLAPMTAAASVTVEITTDRYGSETTWNVKKSSGATVLAGGPYSDASSNGAYPQTSKTLTLLADECYTLTVNDSYGDGMNSGYGVGFVRIVDGSTTLTQVSDFTDVANGKFATAASLSVEDQLIQDLNVYPNPFSSIATVSFENAVAMETEIKVTNMVGQIVTNEFLGNVSGIQVYEINGNNLEAGIYMVTIKAGNKTTTKRVVLNK